MISDTLISFSSYVEKYISLGKAKYYVAWLNSKGVSGVVIAILLTVIGIAAVLIFWSYIQTLFPKPTPKPVIVDAKLWIVGNKLRIEITVKNIGDGPGTWEKVIITDPDGNEESFNINVDVQPGASASLPTSDQIVEPTKLTLTAGKNYLITVVFKDNQGNEHTDSKSVPAQKP